MGKVVKLSPSPLPGVPIKPSLQPQQPGEVLIRYEVEAAGGCQLNLLGWCCFGALLCTAFPISWLPFVCSTCKKHYQRPVYGYPMATMSFIAPDADASAAAKSALSSSAAAAAAPSILCMDATLEMQALPQHDQEQPYQQQAQAPQQQPHALQPQQSQQLPQQQFLLQLQQQRSLACSPSPPPMSIFVPPSAVPACGFTPDNPFPSRYSPVQPLRGAQSPTVAMVSSPKVSGTQGPELRNPGRSVGLPVSGLAMGLQQGM